MSIVLYDFDNHDMAVNRFKLVLAIGRCNNPNPTSARSQTALNTQIDRY